VAGTPVPLAAAGLPGYVFDYWTGDLTGSENPTSVTMDSDKTVTVYFKPIF
jgi:uncharacterized repeat protein (TIGR02543 family)